ncbi:MAG TPA: hypothetical protein PKN22_01985 [Taishania sp.]|nr:hypothetical protein [Taishania sp.]HNS41501.1 hypothetical protein [Taishania sp.]
MNEKIQHIIQEIRSKKEVLTRSLQQQTTRVQQLEQEVEQLKAEKTTSAQELARAIEEQGQFQLVKAQLENENAELKSLLEAAKKQVVEAAVVEDKTNNNAQIDELVREIEYCIGQLK